MQLKFDSKVMLVVILVEWGTPRSRYPMYQHIRQCSGSSDQIHDARWEHHTRGNSLSAQDLLYVINILHFISNIKIINDDKCSFTAKQS